MFVSKNRETGEYLVEAYDEGIPLPFLLRLQGYWEPVDVSFDEMREDYVHVDLTARQETTLLDDVKPAWARSKELLGDVDVENVPTDDLIQVLRERGGAIHRASSAGIMAAQGEDVQIKVDYQEKYVRLG